MPSAREHLERLAARPRPAGSPAEREARDWCRASLAACGFAVAAEPFAYSALPGRWATPALGVVGVAAVCIAARLAWNGRPGAAAIVLAAVGAGAAAGGAWLARVAVTWLPWGRQDGINLVATRGPGASPHLWLAAHLDSKSQPVPILLRAAGVTALLAVWLAALVAAALQVALGAAPAPWPWLAGAAIVAGLPVAASIVGARSPGALDNASGASAVLRAAELAAPGVPLGILLTSAEELGLAGARAWVRGRSRTPAAAINVDGVDDTGPLTVTYTGRRPAPLLAQLAAAGGLQPMRISRLVPGILTDAVALTDAGWRAVTVSKGTWRTVARIHTPNDNLGRLRGDGAEAVARWLAQVVTTAHTVET
ncbi:MAG TPA: M28 family peptidase [Gemmatimonadaceae bacterium]|nr:M28 family peptidase [Gemmatimonadaceae bacterium]